MDSSIKEKYNIQEITPGDGKNFPKKGQEVTVHYVGTVKYTLQSYLIIILVPRY